MHKVFFVKRLGAGGADNSSISADVFVLVSGHQVQI